LRRNGEGEDGSAGEKPLAQKNVNRAAYFKEEEGSSR
jgi:hypothetical protein